VQRAVEDLRQAGGAVQCVQGTVEAVRKAGEAVHTE
jgi:hypothetical protein